MAAAEYIPLPESPEAKNQIDQDVDDSLESTRLMLNLILPAEKRARSPTTVEVDAQGGQLELIDENAESVKTEKVEDEKNQSTIAKCCAIFLNPCKKVTINKKDNFWGSNDDGEIIENQPLRRRDEQKFSDIAATEQVNYIVKFTKEEHKDDKDANVGGVKSVIDNFQNVALKNDSDSDSDLVYVNTQIEPIASNVSIMYDEISI